MPDEQVNWATKFQLAPRSRPGFNHFRSDRKFVYVVNGSTASFYTRLTMFKKTWTGLIILPYHPKFKEWLTPAFNKWMSRTAFFSNFMQWALLCFLVISAISKILDIREYGPVERYDIRRTHSPRHLNGKNPKYLHLVRDTFLGRAPWEPQFTWVVLQA